MGPGAPREQGAACGSLSRQLGADVIGAHCRRGGSPEDQPHCLHRTACAMDGVREESVSAGAGTKRQVRRGPEDVAQPYPPHLFGAFVVEAGCRMRWGWASNKP